MSRRPGLAGRLSGAWRSAGSGPLGVRSFRLLAGGQFASTIGDFCYAVALPWLVLSTHGGTVLLGTVLACYGVPRTGLIPVGGVLADKVGPRTLMLTADVARGVLVAGLAVLAARHAGPRDGSDDALRLRHLSALGGGSRGARAASRAGAVLPDRRRPRRGGHPVRADAAGVQGVRRGSGGKCT